MSWGACLNHSLPEHILQGLGIPSILRSDSGDDEQQAWPGRSPLCATVQWLPGCGLQFLRCKCMGETAERLGCNPAQVIARLNTGDCHEAVFFNSCDVSCQRRPGQ